MQLVHTGYFCKTNIVEAQLAVGNMMGWALLNRTEQ